MTDLATERFSFDQQGFDAFLQSRDEPSWLRDLRVESWKRFQEQSWPARSDEEWIRTDIRLFQLPKFGLAAESLLQSSEEAAALTDGVELAGSATAFDSRPAGSHLESDEASRGVLFGSLEELVRDHGDLIRQHLLKRAVNPHSDRFASLHSAFWSGGSFLYVPRGVCVSRPFHVRSLLSDGAADFGHTLVILEEGAEATLVAESRSDTPNGQGLHCGAIELLVAPGAHLRYVNMQDWGQGVWHFAHQKAVVDRDASLQWTIAALGSRLAKVNQHVSLVGEGANCQVNGVMFTEGRQHLSFHTLQHHEAAHCRSDFLYKAALQDRSRTVWRGMIKVDPIAQRTDGYQRNDNLLLSSQARADSIPGLEIEADDVRCTHGSTTGKVDEELIFYARCRGFTRREAIRIIVTGFFQQIFDRITVDSVREALGRAIARRVREYE